MSYCLGAGFLSRGGGPRDFATGDSVPAHIPCCITWTQLMVGASLRPGVGSKMRFFCRGSIP